MTRFILRWATSMRLRCLPPSPSCPGLICLPGASWLSLIWLALIFGLVNAVFRPLLKFLTCPLIVLTLGLFVLVINTLLFALTGWIGNQFGVGFILAVPWFWNAFLGGLIVSVISVALTGTGEDELEKGR